MKRKDFIKNTAALTLGTAFLPLLSKTIGNTNEKSPLNVVLIVLSGGVRIQDTLLNPTNLPFVLSNNPDFNRSKILFNNSNTNHLDGLSDLFYGKIKTQSILDNLTNNFNMQSNEIKLFGNSYLHKVFNRNEYKKYVVKNKIDHYNNLETQNAQRMSQVLNSVKSNNYTFTTVVLDEFDNCHNNHSRYLQNLKESDELISRLWNKMTIDLNMKNTLFMVVQDCGRDLSPNSDIYPQIGYNHNDENAKRTFCSLIYTDTLKGAALEISAKMRSNSDVKEALLTLFGHYA
jgi:membrane-anchored protein YejM (alkaline phosphatase superfamily)